MHCHAGKARSAGGLCSAADSGPECVCRSNREPLRFQGATEQLLPKLVFVIDADQERPIYAVVEPEARCQHGSCVVRVRGEKGRQEIYAAVRHQELPIRAQPRVVWPAINDSPAHGVLAEVGWLRTAVVETDVPRFNFEPQSVKPPGHLFRVQQPVVGLPLIPCKLESQATYNLV